MFVPLENAYDSKLYGNKAVNLGVLLRNGFNIPNGIVISSNFEQELLGDKIAILKVAVQNKNYPVIDEIFNSITFKFDCPIDCDLIVRSSSSFEDSSKVMASGIYNSFKSDMNNLNRNIVNCWKSAFSEKAMIYKQNNNIDLFETIGVIIQEFVNADCYGILFTSGFLWGKDNDMILEYSFDGYDAVTDPVKTPVSVLINRESLEKQVLTGDSESYYLNSKLLDDIIYLGRKVEAVFGMPQDIEFCIKDNDIMLLQSRTIVK